MNPQALKGTGFRQETPSLRPRLILTVDGPDKSGKTHFAYTAPGHILAQNIDFGDEGVLQKHQSRMPDGLNRILPSDYNRLLPDGFDRRDLNKLKDWYRTNVVDPFIKDYKAALKAGARTIVWDTATEFWEILRLSHFGKTDKIPAQMYTAVNSEWQELVRLANDSDTNLVMLHQVKDEWESYVDGQGNEKRRTTGRQVRSGNEKIGYLVQAQLVTRYVPAKKDKRGEVREGDEARFEVEVTKCRHNPDLVGMVFTGEMANFPSVAGFIVSELPPSTWE